MQYIPAEAPENYSTLVKRSLKFYVKAFPHVFFLALLTAIVAFTPRLVNLYGDYTFFRSHQLLGWNTLWFLLFDLTFLILFTSILWRLQCRIAGTRDTVLNDIVAGCKKLPRIFVAGVIQSVCINLVNIISLVLLLLFIHAGELHEITMTYRLVAFSIITLQILAVIYIFFMFYFYLPLILTESMSILGALKKSVRLVWGNLWRTISFQVTPWFVYLAVILLIRSLFNIDLHIYFLPTYNITIFSIMLHLLLFTLLIPWIAANFLVQLRDLELRKGL